MASPKPVDFISLVSPVKSGKIDVCGLANWLLAKLDHGKESCLLASIVYGIAIGLCLIALELFCWHNISA